MREHNRAYYAANKEVQKERVKARSRRYRKELRELIRSLKEASPCIDCNVAYPWYVMDYDHVIGNKEHDISVMVANLASKQRILDEIAKCELVCSNCHRERTFSRGGACPQ